MTAQTKNNFTLLRLFLALLVVFGHFKLLSGNDNTTGIFTYADFAVDAFFIVSGYLVYASFDRKSDIGSFYIRRIFRIYPLYFVAIIAQGVAMALVAGGIMPNLAALIKYYVLNLAMATFLAHDLGDILDKLHNNGINPSLWTLKIEVAFYFIMPLLWHFTRRYGNWFLAILYVTSVLFTCTALYFGDELIAKQLPGKISFFVVGIALYRLRDQLALSLRYNIALLVVMIGVCTLRAQLWILPIYPICAGMIVFICALRLPPLPVSHDISYGIYLFHGPLIQFALLFGLFEDNYRFLTLLLLAICTLAILAERLIERPGIALGYQLSLLWNNRSQKHG